MYVGRHTTYRAAVTGGREALVLLFRFKFEGEADAQNQSEKKHDDVTPKKIARKAVSGGVMGHQRENGILPWSNCRCQFRTFHTFRRPLAYCGCFRMHKKHAGDEDNADPEKRPDDE